MYKSKLMHFYLFIIFILIFCTIFYFRSGGKKINADIKTDTPTVKELVSIGKPYVDRYWNGRKYYIGEIIMELDNNLKGSVEIWYKDDRKNAEGVPNIITLEINTKSKKVVRIIEQERNSKIVPGNININKWLIDSEEAINIAKQQLNSVREFKFSSAYITANDIYLDGKETWNIVFFNNINKKSYHFRINPYTGKKYNKEIN